MCAKRIRTLREQIPPIPFLAGVASASMKLYISVHDHGCIFKIEITLGGVGRLFRSGYLACYAVLSMGRRSVCLPPRRTRQPPIVLALTPVVPFLDTVGAAIYAGDAGTIEVDLVGCLSDTGERSLTIFVFSWRLAIAQAAGDAYIYLVLLFNISLVLLFDRT